MTVYSIIYGKLVRYFWTSRCAKWANSWSI